MADTITYTNFIAGLSAVGSATTADPHATVQGGVTKKETLGQIVTLFNSQLQLASGSQVTGLFNGVITPGNVAVFDTTTGLEDSGVSAAAGVINCTTLNTGEINATAAVNFSRNSAAAAYIAVNTNTDNTDDASSSGFRAVVGGTNGGDPLYTWSVTGGAQYSMGIDNNNSDVLKITTGSTPSLGTTLFTMTTTGAVTLVDALSMGSHLINNVTDPVSAQDAATKNYVDTRAASPSANSVLTFDGSAVPTASQTLPTAVQSNITQLGTLSSLSLLSGTTKKLVTGNLNSAAINAMHDTGQQLVPAPGSGLVNLVTSCFFNWKNGSTPWVSGDIGFIWLIYGTTGNDQTNLATPFISSQIQSMAANTNYVFGGSYGGIGSDVFGDTNGNIVKVLSSNAINKPICITCIDTITTVGNGNCDFYVEYITFPAV